MQTATKTIDLTACSLPCYDIVSEQLYHPDLGNYHTYGVRLTTSDYISVLHDVSVSKKTTEWIVEMLNRYEVSPVHLYDVVSDLLS